VGDEWQGDVLSCLHQLPPFISGVEQGVEVDGWGVIDKCFRLPRLAPAEGLFPHLTDTLNTNRKLLLDRSDSVFQVYDPADVILLDD
jgi:hypothetical protein